MKIAEALQERSDLNKKLEQLRARLYQNVRVQEGVEPLEDPAQLMDMLAACYARLETLMVQINKTNEHVLVDGKTMMACLAQRDCLRTHLAVLRKAAETAGEMTTRYSASEIRNLCAIDLPALQAKIDRMAADYRKLDNQIQHANWTNDLEA